MHHFRRTIKILLHNKIPLAFGFILGVLANITAIADYFFEKDPTLSDHYIIFRDFDHLTREIFSERLLKQFPQIMLYESEILESIFSSRVIENNKRFFCGLGESNDADDADPNSSICLDNMISEGILAFYAVTNHSSFPLYDIEVTISEYNTDGFGAAVLDPFLHKPSYSIEKSCLLVFNGNDDGFCLAQKSGDSRIDLSQPLDPGVTLIIPIYAAFSNYLNNDLFGTVITSPFYLPNAIAVDGYTVIDNVRPMSPTPVVSPGDFALRG